MYVDLRAVPDAPDAAAALEALARLDVGAARLGPGWLLGKRWAQARDRWEGRLLLHHACFEAPDAPRWNLAADTEDVRKAAIAGAAETLRVAAGLGAPFYSVEAGWAIAFTRDGRGRPVGTATAMPRALDQLARSLDRLATLADERKIGLLVETAAFGGKDRPAFADPEAMIAMLSRLQAPPLGLQLDAAAVVASARARKDEPEALVRELGPHVRSVVLAGPGHRPLREGDTALGLAALVPGVPRILDAHGLEPGRLREQRELVAAQG